LATYSSKESREGDVGLGLEEGVRHGEAALPVEEVRLEGLPGLAPEEPEAQRQPALVGGDPDLALPELVGHLVDLDDRAAHHLLADLLAARAHDGVELVAEGARARRPAGSRWRSGRSRAPRA
jgi:hypothetical protein